MISKTIDITCNELNNYLLKKGKKISEGLPRVIADSLVTQDGKPKSELKNRIIITVANLEEDRISRSHETYRRQPNGTIDTIRPEVRINLYLLFMANYPDVAKDKSNFPYLNGLSHLSCIINFFQSKPFFNKHNTPELDDKIEKLFFELYPLSFEQQNHLFGSLGVKYLPSILYKVRLIAIQDEEILETGPPIKKVKLNSRSVAP